MNLFDKRLIFNMGKGGVGKSVVSAALTLLALQKGKKVLYVQVNTQDKSAFYLDIPPAEENIRQAAPNLFTVNIRPAAALKEYVLMQVRLELIYRIVFTNRPVRFFLKAVPAMNDLVVLGKIYYHVMQTDKHDRPLYDLIIVDAPATGHGVQMLNLPAVMMNAVQSGPVFREAAAMQKMLLDREITAINLVTIPEEMPVVETVELYHKIRDEFRMPLGCLMINQVCRPLFDAADDAAIDQLFESACNDVMLRDPFHVARLETSWRGINKKFIDEVLRKIDLPVVEIPYLFTESFGRSAVEVAGKEIDRILGSYHDA